MLVLSALAVVFAFQKSPQHLPSPFGRPVRLRHREDTLALTVRELGQGRVQVVQGDQTHEALVQSLGAASDAGLTITLNGVRHTAHACRTADQRWHVQVDAVDMWLEDLSFEPVVQAGKTSAATELRAPFNGKVIRLAVQPGDKVARGDTLLTLESMKLEHALTAPRDAVVAAVAVEVGQQVATNQVLLRFE